MILCIANLLSEAERRDLTAFLAKANFVDGRATAGWHARDVKRNEQVGGTDPFLQQGQTAVEAALRRNSLFQAAARPQSIRPVLFSRYRQGMGYGAHVDDAIMAGMRTDLAFTLFLSPPESYDGGELVIETTGGEQPYKLEAGGLILYPANTLHHVATVTCGERLAAVGWAQSLVRDPARREILFDLDTARQTLFQAEGKSATFDLLSKSLSNLLRQWAEP